MKFYEKRRSLPAVPLVSLIDILAILLIFFIATMTFKKKKTLLNISLPKASEISGQTAVDRRLTLSVTKEEKIYLEEQEIPVESLAPVLVQLKDENPEAKLELKADEGVSLGLLVKVWDGLNQAGISVKDVPARILLNKETTQ